MKIESIEIAGYKNITRRVKVDQLGARSVVVLHGLNNVGKTNILEAIQLPFLLMGAKDTKLPFRQPTRLDLEGADLNDWFTLGAPTPITITVTVTFTPEELERQGVQEVYSCRRVRIGIRVELGVSGPEWQINEYRFGDVDVVTLPTTDGAAPDDPEVVRRETFALWFARRVIHRRFLLVRLNRALHGEEAPRPRALIPDGLALALYDAKESADPERYRRWEAFVRACSVFSDVLGNGVPVVTYDRSAGHAALFLQSEAGRLPAHLLGSGVQQVLAILARLFVSGADVIAAEEPEASLSFGLHARLRDALHEIVGEGLGPSQMFITSHSPQFGGAHDFIAVRSRDGAPEVDWRPPTDAAQFTGQALQPPMGGSAPVSYVTAEGLVRLPPFVTKALGVSAGGGVVFHEGKTEGRVEMLSNATAIAELGWGATDADEE